MIAYRQVTTTGLLGFLTPLAALAGVGAALLGLRRRRGALGWAILVVAVIATLLSAWSLAMVVDMGLPLRSGSGGTMGFGPGQTVELSAGVSAVVPDGWVGELREVPPSERGRMGPVRILDLVPVQEAMPGLMDVTSADRSVTLLAMLDTALPNDYLGLPRDEQGMTQTVVSLPRGGSIEARVWGERQGASFGAGAVSVSAVATFPGASPVALEARLLGTDPPGLSPDMDEDVVLWVVDLVSLSGR